MGNRVEQSRVRLADLECCGGRPFARQRGETQVAMRARLLAMPGLHDTRGGRRKVAAYERAMARGEAFPPAFVIALGGQLMLDDGCHRCTAAAVRGERQISAVVVNVVSRGEADAVSRLLFDLEAAGATWQERLRLAGAVLGPMVPVSH